MEELQNHIVGKNILDMGTGDASIAKILMERSYNLTTVDVRDKTMYEEIAPTIYNGDQLPYEDDSFDTVLILFVLHHANNPKQILQEAKSWHFI